MLFEINIYDIIETLRVIVLFLQIVGFCGLIIFGISRTRTRDSGTINKSVVFPIAGIINIIYLAINERIIYLVEILLDPWSDGPDLWTTYSIVRSALIYMIPIIISLITFGALFLYLGLRNMENFGNHLKYSGISWIIFGVILIVSYSILLLSYIPGLIPYPGIIYAIRAAFIMIPIASIFMVTSSFFFILYAVKVDEKILLFTSISLQVASIVFVINSFVQLILNFP